MVNPVEIVRLSTGNYFDTDGRSPDIKEDGEIENVIEQPVTNDFVTANLQDPKKSSPFDEKKMADMSTEPSMGYAAADASVVDESSPEAKFLSTLKEMDVQVIDPDTDNGKGDLIDNMKNGRPCAKDDLRNKLYNKVSEKIEDMKKTIAQESYVSEMHHSEVNVGDRVSIEGGKKGTIHSVSRVPSWKHGAATVHVKHDNGDIKIHLPSSLTKIKD